MTEQAQEQEREDYRKGWEAADTLDPSIDPDRLTGRSAAWKKGFDAALTRIFKGLEG